MTKHEDLHMTEAKGHISRHATFYEYFDLLFRELFCKQTVPILKPWVKRI